MPRYSLLALALLLVIGGAPRPASSHPLGDFSIDHYSHLRVTQRALRVLYIVDMAEIPAFQALTRLDTDSDRRLSPVELNAFLADAGRELAAGLAATLDGMALRWRIESAELTKPVVASVDRLVIGHAGVVLSTTPTPPTLRIVLRLTAAFTGESCQTCRLIYEDSNFPDRTGWKEIVSEAAGDVRLIGTSVPSHDLSRQLTLYPPDTIPPQHLRAELTFDRGARRREGYAWVAIATTVLVLLIGWRVSRKEKSR